MSKLIIKLFVTILIGIVVLGSAQQQRPNRQNAGITTIASRAPTSSSESENTTTVEFQPTTNSLRDPCAQIDSVFKNASGNDEVPACHCLPESMGVLHENGEDDSSAIWISCTRQNMPSVFRPLSALPSNTLISRLWIWNSLINIIPKDIFAKVRPRMLAIENSAVSVFRKGAFSSIGKRLKVLSLKNNILKNIERKTFTDIDSLESLDLSGNKLTELRKGQFDDLHQLENFQLSGNQIASIEDGTFESMTNLKILNLQDNRLVNITKDTFRGLNNLETLNLHGNNISHISREAFAHMKRLKILNLGSNKIFEVELRSLSELQRLYLNNNSIADLERVSLQDLPHLRVLSLDRNAISRISNSDFMLLARGSAVAQLTTLSLTDNNISEISCRAFEHTSRLEVLSLQHNHIKTLLCSETILTQSVFRPLQTLKKLFLSGNVITSIDDGDLNILPNLKELALDHNQIQAISQSAFKGLNLTKLFLNKNRLYYLPEGLFDSWNTKIIKAVDLSDNPRECICDREWVDNWLRDLGLANAGSFGCMSRCGGKTTTDQRDANTEVPVEEFEDHSFWITVIAGILAVVALIFLVAASYIYMQANCYPLLPGTGGAGLSLRNLPSDMIKLIPSQESLLSFPNPIANGPNGPELLLKPAPPPQPISSISINIGHNGKKDGDNGVEGSPISEIIPEVGQVNSNSRVDKKRVRFDGI